MEIETEILDQKALTTDIQRRSFNFDGKDSFVRFGSCTVGGREAVW